MAVCKERNLYSRPVFITVLVCLCSAFIVLFIHGTGQQFPVVFAQVGRPEVKATGNIAATTAKEDEEKGEVRQVIFLKIHKAASSTVQNILLRFALVRDLNVLLPYGGSEHINEHGKTIDPQKVIPHPDGMKFDILCNHLVFDEAQISPYFPANTVRVGIVRDPLEQALSALAYYYKTWPHRAVVQGVKKYGDNPIRGYLSHPWDFNGNNRFLNNRMSVDFGLPPDTLSETKKSPEMIQNFVRSVDDKVDLVLVSDYFDESMVLLKRRLRWSMKDILYLQINTAQGRFKDTSVWSMKPRYSSHDLFTFRKWAAVDYALYDHFLVKFFTEIAKETGLHEEVSAFRAALEAVSSFCERVGDKKDEDDREDEVFPVAESQWSGAFSVSASECRFMRMKETQSVALAFEKQLERMGGSLQKTVKGSEQDTNGL